jgi:uncharacterized protein (DUF433 family)
MSFVIESETPPLRTDAAGAVRIGTSNVLLEIVIRAFQDGASPETIVQRYPTASLADVYAVVAYYLRHRPEVEDYLIQREERAAEVRERIEREQGDLSEIRERLLKRKMP